MSLIPSMKHPGDWESVAHNAYQAPQAGPRLMEYKDPAVGPRERKVRGALFCTASFLVLYRQHPNRKCS